MEQVVFTPRHLEKLLASYDLPAPAWRPNCTITAAGPKEIAVLLEASWSDSVDSYFTPRPRRYQIYADHDEYTTIFAATKGHLAKVTSALKAAGFSQVDGYQRGW